jgi:predicted nuclease with RNAse H fold
LTIIGIDLAGSVRRNTGICILHGNTISQYRTVFDDKEILEFIVKGHPDLIAIDAPLNLPPGRRTIEDRNGEHFRPCDRELLKRGIRFFPITLGPMRSLTKRGISLNKKFKRMGFRTIEIYPGAAQDIWNIPRKQHGLGRLRSGLERLGIRGLGRTMNGDELDAVSGAFVGRLYLQGKAEVIGNFEQGAIVLPHPSKQKRTIKGDSA